MLEKYLATQEILSGYFAHMEPHLISMSKSLVDFHKVINMFAEYELHKWKSRTERQYESNFSRN